MSRRLAALLWWLPAVWGCTVTAVGQRHDTRPNNACSSDSDCGADSCRDGLCQTVNGKLEALLVSATPPSDSGIPHMTFVTQLDDVPTSGGSLDLQLPGPSHVLGSLVLPKGVTCYPGFMSDDPKNPFLTADDGKSLPATVTFALSERLLGLPQQLNFASTGIRNAQGGYTFEARLPRGEYDVYLVPPPHQLGCAVPPQLYRNFPIDSENAEITFPLSSISQLSLSIRWPKASPSLKGWTVDMIEPLGGNPISTELVLGDASDPGEASTNVDYGAQLSYSTVVVPVATTTTTEIKAAKDLLRFRPRSDQVAPTIYMDRTGLGLLSGQSPAVLIDRFTRLPQPVRVESQLVRLDDGTPVAGFVTLVSTQIYGVDDGIFASYQTTLSVAADGALHAVVPPGTYKVWAVPPVLGGPSAEGALAALQADWDIAADIPVQFGKVLELSPIAAVVGQSSFPGAQVQAVPSPSLILPFDDAFGEGPFIPRAGVGLVDDAGKFAVAADPGLFDVSVQAPESLGFAWQVYPGVEVKDRDRDLGRVTLPRPSLLSGVARVSLAGSQAALGSAAIRAYAYLDKNFAYTRDVKQAERVVQVAETRADVDGSFRLLVPASITAPK